jgi:ABC-type dipeptide/oligopeptide/nickel transport system ATPase component
MARARRRAGGAPDRDADLELLRQMDLEDPERVWSRRPAVLSEGMARRVLLALALAGAPDIVVLDEPTTGLDSHRRQQIVHLVARARAKHGFGMLMVTHEVGDAAALTEVGAVLSGGRLVERLDLGGGEVHGEPEHPAARALVDSWRWKGWQDRRGAGPAAQEVPP